MGIAQQRPISATCQSSKLTKTCSRIEKEKPNRAYRKPQTVTLSWIGSCTKVKCECKRVLSRQAAVCGDKDSDFPVQCLLFHCLVDLYCPSSGTSNGFVYRDGYRQAQTMPVGLGGSKDMWQR